MPVSDLNGETKEGAKRSVPPSPDVLAAEWLSAALQDVNDNAPILLLTPRSSHRAG